MKAVAKTETTGTAVADYGASLMQVIAKAASDPNVDIDKMERLLQMQERVQDRSAEVAFSEAFADMQPELPSISHNGQIVHKGNVISEFSDWPNINKVVTPVLSKHGFSLSFKPGKAEREGHSIGASSEMAEADPVYELACADWESAAMEAETLRAQAEAKRMRFEAWRTTNATKRAQMQLR